jgi:lipid-A-disaccharide synthase-like uncharacterized protein
LAESIESSYTNQKEIKFDDFYENNEFSKDKLKNYLREQTYNDGKIPIEELLKGFWDELLIYIALILFIGYFVTILVEKNENQSYILPLLFLVISILTLITLVIYRLVHISVSVQKKYNENLFNVVKKFRNQFDKELISECKLCAKTKEPEPLNAYNLYTYKKIQQIESSLSGSKIEVYCYSRYRDVGVGIGPAGTDKIVAENLKKGIRYHFFYYENSPMDKGDFNPRNNETYIDMSKSKQLSCEDKYKKCLDYHIYSNARFDVKIYKEDDKYQGYFCLNFPVDAGACERCVKKCQLKSAKGSTDKLLYKKMPHNITMQLYEKLKYFEEIEKKDV